MLIFYSTSVKLNNHYRLCLSLLCVLLIIMLPLKSLAESGFEAKLKTAYMVNIARFTTWPDNNKNIVLCIFSQSSIIDEVKALNKIDETAEFRVSVLVDPENLSQCNMLYLDENTYNPDQNDIIMTAHESLLTISDVKGALESNVAIQFFVRNLKLRFSINQQVVKSREYKISSKLLRLARQMD